MRSIRKNRKICPAISAFDTACERIELALGNYSSLREDSPDGSEIRGSCFLRWRLLCQNDQRLSWGVSVGPVRPKGRNARKAEIGEELIEFFVGDVVNHSAE